MVPEILLLSTLELGVYSELIKRFWIFRLAQEGKNDSWLKLNSKCAFRISLIRNNIRFRFELVFHNLVISNFDLKISNKWYSVTRDDRKLWYDANES